MSAEASNRREFLKDSGKWILLTGAATIAWDYVVEGAPEQAPNYNASEHWWGMIIDIEGKEETRGQVLASDRSARFGHRPAVVAVEGVAIPGPGCLLALALMKRATA